MKGYKKTNTLYACFFLWVCGAQVAFAVLTESKLQGSFLIEEAEFGHSVSIDGDYAIIGVPFDNHLGDAGPVGGAYIYKRHGTDWLESAHLDLGLNSSAAVDIAGEMAITGDVGRALVHRFNGVSWEADFLLLPADGNRGFGWSVALTDGWAVVGDGDLAVGEEGKVYLFRRRASDWISHYFHRADDGADSDGFGYCVDVVEEDDGGGMPLYIVGAPTDDDNGTNSGSVYIFGFDGEEGIPQLAKLTASDGAAMDYFGMSVAISEEYVVVGAYGDDDNGENAGSVYIFRRQSRREWIQVAKIKPSDGAPFDNFGKSVGIDGDKVIVGAPQIEGSGSGSGSAYIFKRTAAGWIEKPKLTASDGSPHDAYGHAVALSGNSYLVGAPLDDDAGLDAGSAYIYDEACPMDLVLSDVVVEIDQVESWCAENSITAAGSDHFFRIEGDGSTGGDVTFTAGNVISLQPGFTVEPGGQFLAVVTGSPFGLPTMVLPLQKDKNADPLVVDKSVPTEFNLYQNYPNPFNPTTTIRYALPTDTFVSLNIYNMLGQHVRKLVNEQQTAGFQEVKWDGKNSAGISVLSGMYIYRIVAGEYIKIQKMTLIK